MHLLAGRPKEGGNGANSDKSEALREEPPLVGQLLVPETVDRDDKEYDPFRRKSR